MLHPALYIMIISLEILVVFGLLLYALFSIYSSLMGSAYVPTKQREVEYILKQIKLKKNQLFLDLGCGDGRVVLTAVTKYNLIGTGIDINPLLICYAKFKAKLKGIKNLEYKVQSAFDVNIKNKDVIYIFLMPDLIKKLSKKLRKESKSGAVIISHGFRIEGWDKFKFKTIKHEPFPTYFYKIIG